MSRPGDPIDFVEWRSVSRPGITDQFGTSHDLRYTDYSGVPWKPTRDGVPQEFKQSDVIFCFHLDRGLPP